MIIPDYARHNFVIKDTDDEQTKRTKQFYLNWDKHTRELEQLQFEQKKIKQIKDIKNIRGKTPIKQLELAYLVDEAMKDYK